MKKRVSNTALLLAALLFFGNAFAQDKEKDKERYEPKFKKTKSYTKSHNLGGSDKVSLANQFGEMKLVTWDKNEIKVDVTIFGKSDDEKRASQRRNGDQLHGIPAFFRFS